MYKLTKGSVVGDGRGIVFRSIKPLCGTVYNVAPNGLDGNDAGTFTRTLVMFMRRFIAGSTPARGAFINKFIGEERLWLTLLADMMVGLMSCSGIS